jgi:hypothetical protein
MLEVGRPSVVDTVLTEAKGVSESGEREVVVRVGTVIVLPPSQRSPVMTAVKFHVTV